jgi:hypothetical protein
MQVELGAVRIIGGIVTVDGRKFDYLLPDLHALTNVYVSTCKYV